MTTIAVFGAGDDEEVRALSKRLAARGADTWVIDLAAYPVHLKMAWGEDHWTLDGRSTEEIAAGYLRRVGRNLLPHASYAQQAPILEESQWAALYDASTEAMRAERAHQSTRNALVQSVARKCPVINPPQQQNLHRQKPLMFARLGRAGLPVPAWTAGNERRRMDAFAAKCGMDWQGAVHKPLAGIYKTLSWDQALEHPWGARPALAQRTIRGDTIRCYVLAGRVLAAARIEHGGTVDSSESQTGIGPMTLTKEQRSIAEATSRALGLSFCGLDLMHDPISGDTWVIDCNLSPMFVNFSYLSGCDIAGHIADHLLSLAGHGGDRRAREVLGMVSEAKQVLADDAEMASLFRRLRGRQRRS